MVIDLVFNTFHSLGFTWDFLWPTVLNNHNFDWLVCQGEEMEDNDSIQMSLNKVAQQWKHPFNVTEMGKLTVNSTLLLTIEFLNTNY